MVGKSVAEVSTHLVLEGAGAVAEHKHDKHEVKKANEELKAEYERWQTLYAHDKLLPLAVADEKKRKQYENFQKQFEEEKRRESLPIAGYQPGFKVPHQTVLYQPSTPGQDYKYEYVPIPGRPGSVYDPSSNLSQTSLPAYQSTVSLPQYSPASQGHTSSAGASQDQKESAHQILVQPEKVLVTIPTQMTAQAGPIEDSYFPEKSAAELEDDVKAQDSDPAPTPPTVDEEIAFLRLRLLQLEFEKREALEATGQTPSLSPQATASTLSPEIKVHSAVSVTEISDITPAQSPKPVPVVVTETTEVEVVSVQPQRSMPPDAISKSEKAEKRMLSEGPSPALPPRPVTPSVQAYPLPPPSPALPPRPITPSVQTYLPPPPGPPPLQTQSPHLQQAFFPPPPPSPRIQQINYPPPPGQPPYPQTQVYVPQPQQSTRQYAPPSPHPPVQPQQQYQFPPPPPSPRPQTQQYVPAPPSPYPQYQPSPSPYPQYQPSPISKPELHYARQDSGYYSAAPTPIPSILTPGHQSNQTYRPASISNPPPAYYPPPAGQMVSGAEKIAGRDYFGQNQGQGQYGVPAGGQRGPNEPDYGAPPPIPGTWRGS
jgi:hypothetical protein